MSTDAVSFHYVTPGEMYMFDYLRYRLKRHQTASSTAANVYSHVSTSRPTVGYPRSSRRPPPRVRVNFTRNKLSHHKQTV